MNKLQTLKELANTERKCCSIGEGVYENFCGHCVRAESIKWVKNWKSISKVTHVHDNEIYAFTSFFNLTEEDLIEEKAI